MFVRDWLLPILIGIVAAVALISILYNNPTVKQAFADIGAMMQLNASRPQVMNVIPVIMETFNNMDEPQSKELELSNAKIWNPLPSQYSCNSENTNESNASNSLNILKNAGGKNIYNYYPQITNKL